MTKESLFAFAKAHPAAATEFLVGLGAAAKADSALMGNLLDLVDGTVTLGQFAATHKTLIANLLADIIGAIL